MSDSPLLAICLYTYKRMDYAVRTVSAIRQHFKWDNYAYFIGDAGSSEQEMQMLRNTLEDLEEKVIYYHSGPYGSGKNWNMAVRDALKYTPFYMRLEDDWVLQGDFDPSIYISILNETPEVGLIRLGYLPSGIIAATESYKGKVFWNFSNQMFYMYAGGPHLTHARFNEYFGEFEEGHSPGDTEVAFDYQVRTRSMNGGPKIIRPNDIGDWGPFGHIGAVPST